MSEEITIPIKKKFYQTWNFWQKILTITFWLLFVFIVYYFYTNEESIKYNPCSYCAREYGLTCQSIEKNLLIAPPNGTQEALNKNVYREGSFDMINLSELKNGK